MRYYVPGATLVQDKRTDATVDLVLGDEVQGRDAAEAVDAALKKPTPVASGAGCVSPSAKPKATASASPSPSA